MSIRVGLVGVGHWHAPRYIEALIEGDAQIVGVSDLDPDKARRVAGDVGCRSYPTHLAMLADSRPDLVFALPRHHEAADVVSTLLDLGLPFAAEKPLGLSAMQLEPIAARARSANVYAAIALVNRYRPIWSALREHVEVAGARAHHAHFRIVNGPVSRYADAGCEWMLDPQLAGGGALRNLGIHAVDAALSLGGGDLNEYSVVGSKLVYSHPASRVEDHATVLLAGPSDLSLTIEVGYTLPTPSAGMTRAGDSEFRIAVDGVYLVEREDRLTVFDSKSTHHISSHADWYRHFILRTLDEFRSDRDPIATIEDCYRAMVLVDAAYRTCNVPWLAESVDSGSAVRMIR